MKGEGAGQGMSMILETIEKENDIKNVAPEDWNQLAEEIRAFLINKISVTGGVSDPEDLRDRRASGVQSRCGRAHDGAASESESAAG